MRIAITGTTSGIGKGLKTFLEKSHEVISIDRTHYNLNDIAALNSIDLSNINVLINNAGHANGGGHGFIHHDPLQWINIINTNLIAPLFLTQKFLKQNTKGKIIFITSKCVEKNIGGDSVYSSSKNGLSTFIECMRDELKNSEINLVEIRPGRVKTNFAKNRKIHSKETIDTFYDNKKHMTIDEIVDIVNICITTDIIKNITVEK